MILKKNKDKIFEQDECSKFVIQSAYNRGDLLDIVKINNKNNVQQK